MRWGLLLIAACGPAPTKPVPPHERPITATPVVTPIEVKPTAGFDRGLDLAFDNAPPSFAYVSGDQVMVFDYDRSAIDGPRRSSFVVYQLGRAKAVERLPIIDDDLWRGWVEPPAPTTVDVLKKRGAAVSARVQTMRPLTKISDWRNVPLSGEATLQIGDATLASRLTEGSVRATTLELSRRGQRIRSEVLQPFDTKQMHQEDEAWLACSYDPNEVAAYSDGEKVLVMVRYHYSIDCDDRDHAVRLWSLR